MTDADQSAFLIIFISAWVVLITVGAILGTIGEWLDHKPWKAVKTILIDAVLAALLALALYLRYGRS